MGWILISSNGIASTIREGMFGTSRTTALAPTTRSRQVQSRSSGRPALIGQTSTGKRIIVIYERHKDAGITVVRPVSAYEIEE
jgi:hypothetical protein